MTVAFVVAAYLGPNPFVVTFVMATYVIMQPRLLGSYQ